MRLEQKKVKRDYLNKRRAALGNERFKAGSRSFLSYEYILFHRLDADVRSLIRRAAVPQGGIACDLGCGNSPYRKELEGAAHQVISIDLDHRTGASVAASLNQLPLRTGSLDLALCTQTIEHVADPLVVLADIVRSLKPGGRLIISAPFVWFYHPHPGDYFRFTGEGLEMLCRSAGLEPIELRAQGGAAACLLQILSFLIFGVLGPFGAPLFALLNAAATPLDWLFQSPLFCLNYVLLAEKHSSAASLPLNDQSPQTMSRKL